MNESIGLIIMSVLASGCVRSRDPSKQLDERRGSSHSAAKLVLWHYFRPGRDAFRDTLGRALPQMLTGGTEECFDLNKEVLQLGKVAHSLKLEELIEKVEALAKTAAA